MPIRPVSPRLARPRRSAPRLAALLALLVIASCQSSDVGVQRAAVGTDAGPDAGPEPSYWCDPSLNLVMGTSGDDVLTGTSGADCIVGLGGDDTLDGLGGDDTLWGGSGDDVLHGGDGDDWLEGQTGADELHGDDGWDVLQAGDGDDVLYGGAGLDVLKGLDGCDRLVSTSGEDQLYGGEGDDAIFASADFHSIYGEAGDDVIHAEGTYPTSAIDGGAGVDHCDGDACEAAEPPTCVTNADCATGFGCATPPGVCVPDTYCGGGGSCGSTDVTCDAADDDCDGTLDEDYAPMSTSCGVGACAATGTTSCVSGSVNDDCAPGTPAGSDATCDGSDDDCDGASDEDYVSTSTSCGVGACAATGTTSCVSGSVSDDCAPGTPAGSDATCDGADDDCDGTSDEDYASTLTSCGVGVCASTGATSCVGGSVADSCAPGSATGADDDCDGLDDDCDGAVDEAYASVVTSCGVGSCSTTGVTSCVAGAIVDSCAPGSPSPDTSCDAVDQDCDGALDEGYVSTATSCGVGGCAATGSLTCTGGAVVDTCTPGSPAALDDVCDGVDADCDAATDEDFAPYCAGTDAVTCVSGAESSTSCDDGEACNGDETCAAGACAPGTPPTVDDGNPCTDDACDPATGVSHTPTAAGASCDDGDVCNGDEVCDGAGVCDPGTPLDPDDGDPCTDDVCDPVSGVSNPPAAAGTDCDDGDACNGLETCDGAGFCVPGTPPVTGPCVPSAPTARIYVDEFRDVTNPTVGGAVVSYEGTAAPTFDDTGLDYNPTGVTDGAADVVLDLAGSEVVVVSQIRLWDQFSGAELIEIWTSDTGVADTDFALAETLSIPFNGIDEYVFDFAPRPARYVRLRVLENHQGTAGAGRLTDVSVWTRPRDGGALSLSEAGVAVSANEGLNPQRATDFATSTAWTVTGTTVGTQTITIDLPGTGWHVVDRVRVWGGFESWMQDFEVWVSSTGDAPGDFSQVLSATLPHPGLSRYYWFTFAPTAARYVQLRPRTSSIAGRVNVHSFQVFTPHEGGLTVPFTDRSVAGGDAIVGWRWDFGDGSGSVDQHPTHTYAAPGSYVVTLQTIGEYGVNDTATFAYTAHAPPSPDFDPGLPLAQGDTASFQDLSTASAPLVEVAQTVSGDPVNPLNWGVRYPVTVGGVASWPLLREGTLRVTWEAVDARLLGGAITRDLEVDNVAPTIDVGSDQTLVWGQPWRSNPAPVTITDATSAEWFSLACSYDFGDGTLATGPDPCLVDDFYVEHAWADPGSYVVTATATDPRGGTGTDAFRIEVTRRTAALAIAPVPRAETGGPQPVSVQLMDGYDPSASMAGKAVELRLGAQTVSATTDASGVATGTLTFPGGAATALVTAAFAGDTHYFGARGEVSFPETLRPSYPGNCGTDYWIALPNPCDDDGGECPRGSVDDEAFFRHYLQLTAEASTSVQVDLPGLGRTLRAVVGEEGVAQLELPIDEVAAVRSSGDVTQDAIHITSDRIVCVHALEHMPQGSDGFLALPTNALGTEYVVGAYEGRVTDLFVGPLVDQFVVVGTQAGTDVTVTPSFDVVAGDGTPSTSRELAGVPFVVHLDEGEAIQLRAYAVLPPGPGASNYDLTGTTVSATAPVAVMSGHRCAYVPVGVAACNTLVEQLPALEHAGTEFLATPFAGRGSGYLVRVVAGTTPTEVRLDGTLVATLSRGEHYELNEPAQVAHVLTTTEPALAVQLAKGLNEETGTPPPTRGDPTMLVLVPSEQFDNGATVSTVIDHEYERFDGREWVTESWAFDNYLNLVVPTADAGGVRVDGAVPSAAFTVIPGTTWSYAQEPVTAGAHQVTHTSPVVRVGVSVYGWEDYDGYAFPARMRLTELAGGCTPTPTVPGDGVDNDCDGRYDEELGDGLDDDGDGLSDEDLFFESPPPVNLQPFAYDRTDAVLEDTSRALVLLGSDPNGDPITYEILSGPSHGALSGAGNAYDYTPAAGYVGADAFTYRVCDDGALCSDPATFAITVVPDNDAPAIALGALYSVFENERFELILTASDPEGDALTWSLVAAPVGVTIDSALSRLTWTPDERFSSQTWPVTVAVEDGQGGRDEVSFGIQVIERPDAPVIVSLPVRTANYGEPYVYDVDAVDPDPGATLQYFLLDGPAAMAIDLSTGVLSWTPTLADVGTHAVEVIAQDNGGLLSEPQQFDVTVGGDTTAPTVTITADLNPVVTGDPITLTVTAVDDVSAVIEGLDVAGTPVTLDAFGVGTWTPTASGRFVASASAVDPTGNRGTATLDLRVLDPSDSTPPQVELTAPAANDVLTYLHDAIGTVLDDNLYRWTLDIRAAGGPGGGGAYRTLLTGTTTVTDGVLGQLDVTQVRNGIHHLRLRAEDVNGQVAEDIVPVRIDGGAKLGIVHLEFTDLVVPDFGIPIAVNRVYDSRDAGQPGDFGYGWNLDIRQGSITQNYPPGRGMAQYTTTGDFQPCTRFEDQLGHYAEVRLGDDEWYTFRPILTNVITVSGGCGGTVAYEQVDGSRPDAELIPLGNRDVRATALPVIGIGGFALDSDLVDNETAAIYDPQDFELRLTDGRTLWLNVARGITAIRDRNGNQLNFVERGVFGGPGGMVHSSGRNVVFVEDAQGRISQIIDGSGRSVGYEYSADGDLAAFIDVLGRRTTFEYGEPRHPHYLTAIVDWRGVRTASVAYDDGGRMRELCDADGTCAQQSYDLAAQTMLRFEGLPNPTRYAYDARGNITRVENGLGETTRYTYGPAPLNVLTRREDPDGAITRYEYLSETRELTAVIEPHEATEDPNDFRTEYGYRSWINAAGTHAHLELVSVTLPTGGVILYDTDDDGNQIAVRDDAGNTVLQRTFNPDGSVASVTDRFGTHSYVYGPEGRPTQVTEPDGAVSTLTYHPSGEVATLTRSGVTQRFERDAMGRPSFTDYGNGATVTYEYSNAESWTAIHGPTFGRVERTLSSAGRLLRWTMPNGDTGAQTFDAAGQLRTSTDALGNVTTQTYDAAGQLAASVDPIRGATTYTRDAMGRPLTITDPSGEVRAFTYDIRGNVLTSTDARGNVTTTTSLPTGSTSTTALGHTSASALSSYGLPSSSSYPGGASSSVSFLGRTGVDDSSSFPLTQTDESGRVRSFTYDANSVLQTASDLAGNAWTYGHAEVLGGDVRYDVFSGDVRLGVDGARAPVSGYGSRDEERDGHRPEQLDAWVDRLQQVTSPLGEVTSWTFGAGGEITRVDYPFGGALTRTLGADLRVATETRPFGTTLTYTRDAAGRITGRAGSDGSSETYVYGPQSRYASITDATGTTSYGYDAAGRLSGLDYPSGAGFEQDWSDRDELTAMRAHGPGTTPTVYESQYTYDAAGNVATVTDPFGRVTTYSYDADNQLTEILRPNGVRTTRTYDARGWVASVTHTASGGAVLASVSYVRSPSGEPTRVTREDGSYVTVTYDAALRVEREDYYDSSDTLVDSIAYTYDADGNRTSRTTSAGTESYVYASGSRLERVELGGATVADFTYDGGARVTRIQRGSQDLSVTYDADDHAVAIEDTVSTVRREFDFDAEGRRTGRRRLVAGALAAALTMVTAPTMAANLDSPHLSFDTGTGVPSTGYVFDGEHALARYDAASTEPVYYLRDGMGSVIGVVDHAGTGSARIHYDGFGNIRSTDGALATLPDEGGPRFQGMWLEQDGLYYVRARNYDAETGRFLSRDPERSLTRYPETAMPYVFAASCPLLLRDPTGRLFKFTDLAISARIRNILHTIAGVVAAFGQRILRALQAAQGAFLNLLRGLPRLLQATNSISRAGPAASSSSTRAATQLLSTPRGNLLQAARNPQLRNLIEQLYRRNAQVGSGSTADAIRYERATGQLLSQAGHAIKGQEMRTALLRLFRSGNLDPADRQIARGILIDLQGALSGQ